MKKVFLLASIALAAMTAQAQTALAATPASLQTAQGKFFDNWSIGIKGGVTAPFNGCSFWPHARGIMGVELRKQITPIFGLGAEGEWTVNTSSWTTLKSANVFDHQYVGVFGTFNLMNAFAGYKGTPRLFEIEAVAGTGWLHSYYPKAQTKDGNSWGNKVGLNFNFNLGEAKAWTIALKPSILWNMGANPELTNLGYSARYDSNHAAVEIQAGVTYHFKNSNGTHSFVMIRPYDQAEVDALNNEINRLRAELDNCGANNAALQDQLNKTRDQLNDCLNRPVVQTVVKDLNNIRYVFFNQGSAYIQANQKPNIWMVAQTVKENNGSTVEVLGYASKEGSKALNQRLSEKRAQAVKKALVQDGVDADRIEAKGLGVGDLFETNSWNRVAKCTVKVAE